MSHEDNFDVWDYVVSHELSLADYQDLKKHAEDMIELILNRMEQEEDETYEMDLEEVT